MPLLPHCRPPRGRALLLLASLTACTALGPAEDLPASAEPFAMPAAYQSWWARTESCAGRVGHLERIEWYVVPGVESFQTELGPRVGLWSHSAEGIRIVIAGRYLNHELVVRHEMLHALLGQGGHPDGYLQSRCQLTWETWSAE